jgi:hypothetical protein
MKKAVFLMISVFFIGSVENILGAKESLKDLCTSACYAASICGSSTCVTDCVANSTANCTAMHEYAGCQVDSYRTCLLSNGKCGRSMGDGKTGICV